MKILSDLEIKVPNGRVARTPDEAFEAAEDLGTYLLILTFSQFQYQNLLKTFLASIFEFQCLLHAH